MSGLLVLIAVNQDGYQKGLSDGREKQIQELKDLIGEQSKQLRLLQYLLTKQNIPEQCDYDVDGFCEKHGDCNDHCRVEKK